METHVHSTPAKKRCRKRRKEVPTPHHANEHIKVTDTTPTTHTKEQMPNLENWDGGLKIFHVHVQCTHEVAKAK